MRYRPEIDGLRAIAVTAVVLQHAAFAPRGLELLSGGFVGVDVFFVISGYLIASILMREIDDGAFRLARFYERRARRILPALFTVMIATVPCAWALMLPKAMHEFAASSLCVIAFASNVCFSREDGYWAEPSALKPLLHTWSLAVEEQFYLLFPLALLALRRLGGRSVTAVFALALVASLQLAHWGSAAFPDAAFYLLPTRAWELLAGVLLATLPPDGERASRRRLAAFAPAAGLLLIGSALLFFDDRTRHPSYLTLLPIVGTCLVIRFARPGEPVTDRLSSWPLVAVGRISYGLYLWHFPVFAFARMLDPQRSAADEIAAIGVSVALAVATWYLVEKPFRDPRRIGMRPLVLATGSSGILLFGVGAFAYANPIVRMSVPRFAIGSDEEMLKNRNRYWEITTDRMVDVDDFRPERISVVVIGDSWGMDTANAIAYDPRFEVALASYPHVCELMTMPRSDRREPCDYDREILGRSYASADVVVFADHGPSRRVDDARAMTVLDGHVRKLRADGFGGPIAVIGNRPLYSVVVPRLAFTTPVQMIDRQATASLLVPLDELRSEDERNASYFETRGLHYFSLLGTFCPEGMCTVVHDGEILWMDGGARYGNHLNMSGAKYLSHDIAAFLLGVVRGAGSQPSGPVVARTASRS